jgi:hypothetical protein
MKRESPTSEMRSSGRVRTYFGGRVTLVSPLLGVNCLVRDLSEGGAQIVMSGVESLPNEIQITVPRINLATRARVVWRNGDVCGVQFLRDAQATSPQAAFEAALGF